MLKLVAGVLAASAVLSFGVIAGAETSNVQSDIYYGSDNYVKPDLSGTTTYTAVMIKKVKDIDGNDVTVSDGSNIVYINQSSEDGLNSAVSFLLKNVTENGAEPGYYQAVFGNENGDTSTINFVVNDAGVDAKDAIVKACNPVQYMNGETKYYAKGFVKDNIVMDDFSTYNSIKFVSAGGSYLGALRMSDVCGDLSGGASVSIKLQVNNIPDGQQDMNVYFSADEVAEVSATQE